MAGEADLDAWWRNIQVGDVFELFVMGDVVQESETRRRSKKGRDDPQNEGWRPCTVIRMEGTGPRAKAVLSFTDLSGNKTEETIPIRDSGGGRLRQCAKTEDEKDRSKAKKGKKAVEDSEEEETSVDKSLVNQGPQGAIIVGMRVKVLYDEEEWYEGIVRNPTKKAGEFCIVFEDDETTTAKIPSPEGDVELILSKEELCEITRQSIASDGGLVYRVLQTALVRSRSLKSNQELPAPYTQLLASVMNSVLRKIRCPYCSLVSFLPTIVGFQPHKNNEGKDSSKSSERHTPIENQRRRTPRQDRQIRHRHRGGRHPRAPPPNRQQGPGPGEAPRCAGERTRARRLRSHAGFDDTGCKGAGEGAPFGGVPHAIPGHAALGERRR